MHEVTVEAEWQTLDTFEFDTEEEAEEFRQKVNAGGQDGLEAIVEAGDITSQNGDLVNWRARR